MTGAGVVRGACPGPRPTRHGGGDGTGNGHRVDRPHVQPSDTAFFFKQWGEFAPQDAGGFFSVSDRRMYRLDELGRLDKPGGGDTIGLRRVGKKNAGRMLDGREWSDFPEVAAK